MLHLDGLNWPLKVIAQNKSQETISESVYPLGDDKVKKYSFQKHLGGKG